MFFSSYKVENIETCIIKVKEFCDLIFQLIFILFFQQSERQRRTILACSKFRLFTVTRLSSTEPQTSRNFRRSINRRLKKYQLITLSYSGFWVFVVTHQLLHR